MFWAEPWSDEARKELEEDLHIKAYDSYGFLRCSAQESHLSALSRTAYIFGRPFHCEVLDNNDRPCAPGEPGELCTYIPN